MNKKAQGFLTTIKMIESLKIILLIVFSIGIFLYLLSPKSISPEVEKEVYENIYLRSITGNPACFAYDGIGGRVDQRILDINKLKKENLNDCMGIPKNRDYSDWHSAATKFKELDKQVNTSEWVYPLVFDYLLVPVLIKDGSTYTSETMILYMQLLVG